MVPAGLVEVVATPFSFRGIQRPGYQEDCAMLSKLFMVTRLTRLFDSLLETGGMEWEAKGLRVGF